MSEADERTKCFAYGETQNGHFQCLCLDKKYCEGISCRFYKTKEQCTEEAERTEKRIESLPVEQQVYIKGKYRGREMSRRSTKSLMEEE